MLNITIICPGHTKEEAFKLLEAKFTKHLINYATVDWLIVKESRQEKNQPVEVAREAEGAEILKRIPKNCVNIVLDERGKELRSEQFAEMLQSFEAEGKRICFIIGGTFGLSEEVKSQAHHLLALSKMTLTHEMTRSLLLEQVYRGISICKGKKYHY